MEKWKNRLEKLGNFVRVDKWEPCKNLKVSLVTKEIGLSISSSLIRTYEDIYDKYI